MSGRSDALSLALLGAGVALAAAVLLGLSLSQIAKPPEMAQRLTALDAQARQAELFLRTTSPTGPAAPSALCRDRAEGAHRLQDSIGALANQVSLAPELLDVRAENTDRLDGLQPLRVRLTATGSYESAVALLAALARQTPQVFVDSLDLTPKVSNVTLTLSGRAFCAS